MKKNIILIVVVWITLLLTFSLTSCSASSDAPEEVTPTMGTRNAINLELETPIQMWEIRTDYTGKEYKDYYLGDMSGEAFDGTYLIKIADGYAYMVGSSDERPKARVDVGGFLDAKSAYLLNEELYLIVVHGYVYLYQSSVALNSRTVPEASKLLEFRVKKQ